MPDRPRPLAQTLQEKSNARSLVDRTPITCYKIRMDNTTALVSQFHNIATMHSFKIVNQRMEFAWNECDPEMIQETYDIWNDLIGDVIKFVPADNV